MRPGKVRAHGSSAPKECGNGPAVLSVWDAAAREMRATSAVKRRCPGNAAAKSREAAVRRRSACLFSNPLELRLQYKL